MMSPFLPQKSDDLFSHRPTPSPLAPSPPFYLMVWFIQCSSKFSKKFTLSFGCHPLDGVTRGGPPSHRLP